jgi:hypothetical protein
MVLSDDAIMATALASGFVHLVRLYGCTRLLYIHAGTLGWPFLSGIYKANFFISRTSLDKILKVTDSSISKDLDPDSHGLIGDKLALYHTFYVLLHLLCPINA